MNDRNSRRDPPVASCVAHSLDFRRLFESAPAPYLVLDPDLRIAAVSDAYLSATMTRREDIVGRDLFEVFPDNPHDPSASGARNLRASLQMVLRTGRPHTMPVQQYDIRRPDSEGGAFEVRFWSPVNSPVIVDGRVTHVIHRVQDVTDFVRLEQETRERERQHDQLRSSVERTRMELYQRTQELHQASLEGFVARPDLGLIPRSNLYLLLMQAPAAVCVLRAPALTIEFANPVFQELAGEHEILGRGIREVLADASALLEPLDDVVGGGKPSAQREVTFHSTGPGERTFSFVYQPLETVQGEVESVVLLGFDVTDQVRARKTLEANAEQMRAADQAKDEFIAVISHELRTPMTSILGWTRMLALGGLDPQTHREALDALERSTRAQAKLIEDLLDEARISSGRLRLDLRAADLVALVDEAVRMARPSAEAKGVVLSLTAPQERYQTFGDPARLQQVIGNVLGNAIKFTPEEGRVTVRLGRRDSSAVIEVTDSGRGIEPSLLPFVFDRFRQGTASGERQGGLGLGLAITRHLVEMHGGSVEATSDGPGKGATFRILLPLHEQEATGPSFIGRDAGRAHALPELSGVRVLMVEDEVDNRNVLAMALQRCGAEVRCTTTAEAATRMIDAWPPDVLICDIALPDSDGCSFLMQLRDRGVTAPALALTVLGRPQEQARIVAAGFEIFRQKPIDPVDLAHEVARLARRQEPESAVRT